MPAGPGAPGAPGAGAPGWQWQPPTDVERALYAAKLRGDWPAYLDVLGGTWLFYAVPRLPLDATGQHDLHPYWNAATRSHCFAVLTHGMLPVPVEDPVYVRTTLGTLAAAWPDERWWMAVDPGSPAEAYFPGTLPDRGVWREHGKRAWRGQSGALRTLHTGGPLHGPVAHGLACGALHCVNNGSLWNAMGWHGTGYDGERERVRDTWGIRSRADWQYRQEQLLAGAMSDPDWEFVLRVRRQLVRTHPDEPAVGAAATLRWREATEKLAREREPERGPEPDPGPGPGPEGEPGPEETGDGAGTGENRGDRRGGGDGRDRGEGDRVRRLQGLIGRITRYESRYRSDGLLPADGYVRSVLAWDHGLASKMARWGLGGRWCTLAEAEDAVVRAGAAARETYATWEEFSLGYVLGRCLHFDAERYGSWYTDMVTAHRILTTDPGSPWRNIPFR